LRRFPVHPWLRRRYAQMPQAWSWRMLPDPPALGRQAPDRTLRHAAPGLWPSRYHGLRPTPAHACLPDQASCRLDPRLRHVAISCQDDGMISIGRARRLQNIESAIPAADQIGDGRTQLGIAGTQRHRGASQLPIFDMYVQDTRKIGGNFLDAVISQRSAI